MIILNDRSALDRIKHPEIGLLVRQRLAEAGDFTGIVVETGGLVADLETVTGCPILQSLFADVCFPDDDYAPAFEVIEDHGHCFEMVFILNDDSAATVLFIPKAEGIDADLIGLCHHFAI